MRCHTVLLKKSECQCSAVRFHKREMRIGDSPWQSCGSNDSGSAGSCVPVSSLARTRLVINVVLRESDSTGLTSNHDCATNEKRGRTSAAHELSGCRRTVSDIESLRGHQQSVQNKVRQDSACLLSVEAPRRAPKSCQFACEQECVTHGRYRETGTWSLTVATTTDHDDNGFGMDSLNVRCTFVDNWSAPQNWHVLQCPEKRAPTISKHRSAPVAWDQHYSCLRRKHSAIRARARDARRSAQHILGFDKLGATCDASSSKHHAALQKRSW